MALARQNYFSFLGCVGGRAGLLAALLFGSELRWPLSCILAASCVAGRAVQRRILTAAYLLVRRAGEQVPETKNHCNTHPKSSRPRLLGIDHVNQSIP